MTDKSPKISVIVPVYNVDQYLHRCIDSILAQTFTNFELLLIDDGSKDNSGKICDEYAHNDNRIKVFHTQNNGASAARNYGIDKSVGEYISFIDSDDWIEPSFYSDFFGNDDYEYDIYFQNYICHNQDGTTTYKKLSPCSIKGKSLDDAILYLMKEVKFGWSWIKIFKHSIITDYKLRFDYNISFREDELFTLQYCQHIKSLCIRSATNYHYYIHPNSLTRSFNDPKELIRITTLIINASKYIKSSEIEKYNNNYYLENLYYAVIGLYIHGVLPNYNKEMRYSVIESFLSFYYSHDNIKLHYASFKAKCLYKLLWSTNSPQIIDYVFCKWFHVYYKE